VLLLRLRATVLLLLGVRVIAAVTVHLFLLGFQVEFIGLEVMADVFKLLKMMGQSLGGDPLHAVVLTKRKIFKV
jgi:hypothetical protein